MGSNQVPSFKKRFYHVKVKNLELASLRKLGQQMNQVQRQAFSKVYEKIWDLAMIGVSVEAIASLTQYYDQSPNKIGLSIRRSYWGAPDEEDNDP